VSKHPSETEQRLQPPMGTERLDTRGNVQTFEVSIDLMVPVIQVQVKDSQTLTKQPQLGTTNVVINQK
jgi:hypothetical protein